MGMAKPLSSGMQSVFRLEPSVFSIRLCLKHLNIFPCIPKRKRDALSGFSDKTVDKKNAYSYYGVKGLDWYGKWGCLKGSVKRSKFSNWKRRHWSASRWRRTGKAELPDSSRTRWILYQVTEGAAIVIYGRKNKRNQVVVQKYHVNQKWWLMDRVRKMRLMQKGIWRKKLDVADLLNEKAALSSHCWRNSFPVGRSCLKFGTLYLWWKQSYFS